MSDKINSYLVRNFNFLGALSSRTRYSKVKNPMTTLSVMLRALTIMGYSLSSCSSGRV